MGECAGDRCSARESCGSCGLSLKVGCYFFADHFTCLDGSGKVRPAKPQKASRDDLLHFDAETNIVEPNAEHERTLIRLLRAQQRRTWRRAVSNSAEQKQYNNNYDDETEPSTAVIAGTIKRTPADSAEAAQQYNDQEN
jgi:hypothetical protein